MRAVPLVPRGSGVRWTLTTSLDAPLAELDRRSRTCREVWDAVAQRAVRLGLEAPGGTVVRTRRGSLVLVCGGGVLAGALIGRDAVVSVVAYELRERLGAPA
jgi:hypothetical protein